MAGPSSSPLIEAAGARVPGNIFRLVYAAYDLSAGLLTVGVLIPAYLVLILLGRRRWRDIWESLGWPAAVPPQPSVMIHGVSAGEVRAGARLLPAWPGREVLPLLSFRTGDARAALELLPESRFCRAPWDFSWCVRRWLRCRRIAAVVLVENEIWPGLLYQASRLGIPTILVSARIYPRDIPRYRLLRAFFAPLLGNLLWIGAQDDEQAEALVTIGAPAAKIEVMGNLKWEAARPQSLPGWMEEELSSFPPLVVAGSTHGPEERLLAEALPQRLDQGQVRLLIAPRKTGRAAGVAHRLRESGLAVRLWSNWQPGDRWQVLVLDRFGWLPSLYPWAAIAFVGGSLLPRGGQNPLEAISPNTALVVGPYMEHFAAILGPLREAGGILQLQHPGDLSRALNELLDDPVRRSRLAGAAAALADRFPAPSRRVLEVIDSLDLAGPGRGQPQIPSKPLG